MRTLTMAEILKEVRTNPDFIYLKRFDYSLEALMDRFPNGVPIKIIAQALVLTEEEVEQSLESALSKLRNHLKIELD